MTREYFVICNSQGHYLTPSGNWTMLFNFAMLFAQFGDAAASLQREDERVCLLTISVEAI